LCPPPLSESQGRTPQRGVWRRTHVNPVPHIFAPFSFDPAILLTVNGAAMFVGRVPTVSVDSSTLHYDEYRVRK
jgi:hypothetical protein